MTWYHAEHPNPTEMLGEEKVKEKEMEETEVEDVAKTEIFARD